MNYALSTVVDRPLTGVVEEVRAALAEQGFGILSEIDLSATLKAKLGVDVEPWVILGACNAPLAHAALQDEPSIGLLLPCNVVVRSTGDGSTLVEAVNPQTMVTMSDNAKLQQVADDAGGRLSAALASLAVGAVRAVEGRVPGVSAPVST